MAGRFIESPPRRRPRWAVVAAIAAILFGIVTVIVGGKTLFGTAERAAAGHIVPFVLWFNFIAGFAYCIAGTGLFLWKGWAAPLSAVIALATLLVFAAFGIHILLGGEFEMRTVGAMTIRSAAWLAISIAAYRALGCSACTTA